MFISLYVLYYGPFVAKTIHVVPLVYISGDVWTDTALVGMAGFVC